jgi:class 3 adenylate cyclase
MIGLMRRYWGSALGLRMFARLVAPSAASDMDYLTWCSTWLRLSASPGAAASFYRMNAHVDIRGVLPAIRVPTLLLHRRDDRVASIEQSRYMAEQIPGARLVELPGVDHFPCVGDVDSIVDHVEEFLTGTHTVAEQERILATVLFTDIVGSTERAAALGDRRWRELLEMHHSVVRREIARWRGREVSTEGDSFLATFDGPARAIRCARGITAAVHELGIDVRAGLHTGECEVMGDDIGGIAVHIGARVKALADPREVFVSSTVKDLVTGSGIEFRSRGTHVLKGVPGEWRLFSVEQA